MRSGGRGVPVVMTISEHTPVHEMMKCYYIAREKGTRLFGPNSFGVISPGKCKAGFMPHKYFIEGNVGVMSRSATNCYETVMMMSQGRNRPVNLRGDWRRYDSGFYVYRFAAGF